MFERNKLKVILTLISQSIPIPKPTEMIKIRCKKEICISVILIFFVVAGFSQTNLMPVAHYVFPEFTKGIVLMKNGNVNEAVLNYNSLTEEMIFETRGTKLALSQIETIDTVFIGTRKFIPRDNAFLEVLLKSKYSLYVAHKCKLKDPGKPSGYGTTSQTSAITTYSKFFTNGKVYDMKLPEGYDTQPSVEYWLDKDGKLNKFISIRQLSKLFANKQSEFKAYLKKHDVDYDNQTNVVELVRYLQEN